MNQNGLQRQGPDVGPVTLMLVGGGIRYHAFIGALRALEELGITVGRIVGASTGSAVAALYAAGLSPEELHRLDLGLDTVAFRDFAPRGAFTGMGLCRGDVLEEWLETELQGKCLGDRLRVPLSIIATDIQSYSPCLLSADNAPDLPISRAVRFSSAIPLVYTCKRFVNRGREHVFIDGALMANVIESQFADAGRTLVIKTFSKRSLNQHTPSVLNLRRYGADLLALFYNAMDREFLKGGRWKDTITVHCGTVPPLSFSLSASDKTFLYEQGYHQVTKFLRYKWGF
ncbi:MAG: phospholipase [Desulfuromonadales bacterium]|nr:MAG: phospholipase [Desulfuromonadales bacterium]